ncbi:unnamed protein product, partial [marine sediment metagenome]
FCQTYCINGHNASQAYKIAYPKANNGHNAHGAKLIAIDSIKQRIEEIQAEVDAESDVTVEEIVKALRFIGFGKVATNKDKIGALTLLGKYKTMYTDKIETSKPIENKVLTPAEEEQELKTRLDRLERARRAPIPICKG